MLVAHEINEAGARAQDAGDGVQATEDNSQSSILNPQFRCVYGAYVRGRFWFFGILSGSQYCFSDAFAATRDDIFDIFRTLKVLKQIIIRINRES
jgi:hypothetical protein